MKWIKSEAAKCFELIPRNLGRRSRWVLRLEGEERNNWWMSFWSCDRAVEIPGKDCGDDLVMQQNTYASRGSQWWRLGCSVHVDSWLTISISILGIPRPVWETFIKPNIKPFQLEKKAQNPLCALKREANVTWDGWWGFLWGTGWRCPSWIHRAAPESEAPAEGEPTGRRWAGRFWGSSLRENRPVGDMMLELTALVAPNTSH